MLTRQFDRLERQMITCTLLLCLAWVNIIGFRSAPHIEFKLTTPHIVTDAIIFAKFWNNKRHLKNFIGAFASNPAMASVMLVHNYAFWFNTIYTTAASGKISVGATFVGGVAPDCTGASQDQVLIGQLHNLEMDINCILGVIASPTTFSISETTTPGGTGILTIDQGIQFTTVSYVNQGNAAWSIGAGATTWFKSDTALKWNAGDTTVANAILNFNGTIGSHVTIKGTNAAGTANTTKHLGFTNLLSAATAVLNGTYIDCSDIGAAATDGHFWESDFGRSGVTQVLKNFTGTRCGELFLNATAATEGFDLENNSWYDSPETNGGRSLQIKNTVVCSGNPTRKILSTFIKNGQFRAAISSPANSDICVTLNDMRVIGQMGQSAFDGGGGFPQGINMTNVLFYSQSTTGDVRHDMPNGTHTKLIDLMDTHSGILTGDRINFGASTNVNVTIDGAIYELWAASGWGGHGVPIAMVPGTLVVRHTLMLPPTNGFWKSAVVPPGLTEVGVSVTFDNNTVTGMDASAATGKVMATENATTTAANIFPSVQSNLVWSSGTNANSTMCADRSGSQAAGMYGTCDFNNFFNFTAASQYPLAGAAYNVTPGTHDKAVNPNFTDNTRSFLKWGQSIDNSITDWLTIVTRMDMNAAGFNAAYCISGGPNCAYEWIRAGWAPHNALLKGTGASATDIGAVPVVVGCGSGTALMGVGCN